MKALMIAGAHSGSGKTALALGLCLALVRRGLKVQPFKCGPDYLDPTYLLLAVQRPCYNLDLWMCGQEYVRKLFYTATAGGLGNGPADVAIVEGVMGLYDGMHPESAENSTAEIARTLDLPVLLVAPAAAMSRSFAALVNGFATFPGAPAFAGVAANFCGSRRHAELLGRAVASVPSCPPFLGGIEKGAFAGFQSRHLGLVRADKNNLPTQMLNTLADAVEASLDLDRVLRQAREIDAASAQEADAGLLAYPPAPGGDCGRKIRLGLAMDDALHFYYPDNIQALERSGFEVVEFSPLHDQMLPPELDAIYLGGGYPECHGPQLAKNSAIREAMHDFVRGGGAVYGECGGLMYLADGIELADGSYHPMLGLFPVRIRMRGRLHALGYLETEFPEDSPFGKSGGAIRGHEFHYSQIAGEVPADWRRVYRLRRPRAPEEPAETEGFLRGKVFASYFHIHFAASPEAVAAFRQFCTRQRR